MGKTCRFGTDYGSNANRWTDAHNLDKITAQFLPQASKLVKFAPYDTLCWPKATHGFFRFKENIPKFIETLRLK